MQGTLYLIKNKINSKSYIGKTYREISVRFKEHISNSKQNIKRPLYSAINKYGIDSFELIVLGKYEEGILEEKEIEAITQFNTYKNGYNATKGGEGTRNINCSDSEIIETYEKLKNLTKTGLTLGIDPLTCKTALIRNNIKLESHTSVLRQRSKQIVCLDSNQVFDSSYDCAQFLIDCDIVETKDINNVSRSIQRVCDGSRNSYKKLKFSYIQVAD